MIGFFDVFEHLEDPAALLTASLRWAEAGALAPGPAAAGDARRAREREVILDDPARPEPVRFVDRAGLAPGDTLDGPLVIEQPDTTTVVHRGWRAQVVAGGEIHITRSRAHGTAA